MGAVSDESERVVSGSGKCIDSGWLLARAHGYLQF